MQTVDDVLVVSVDIGPSEDHRSLHIWLLLADGRWALWDYELGAPPGSQPAPRIIEGA